MGEPASAHAHRVRAGRSGAFGKRTLKSGVLPRGQSAPQGSSFFVFSRRRRRLAARKQARGGTDPLFLHPNLPLLSASFRSRAAFKLIQLNRQFGFLDNARSVLDLCAAPGGWLQVAAKALPAGATIVGVDLDKIRPIAGVKTLVGDITTPATAAALKRAGGEVAYDAVLHDGAPNVGGAWASEAYSQVRRERRGERREKTESKEREKTTDDPALTTTHFFPTPPPFSPPSSWTPPAWRAPCWPPAAPL